MKLVMIIRFRRVERVSWLFFGVLGLWVRYGHEGYQVYQGYKGF